MSNLLGLFNRKHQKYNQELYSIPNVIKIKMATILPLRSEPSRRLKNEHVD